MTATLLLIVATDVPKGIANPSRPMIIKKEGFVAGMCDIDPLPNCMQTHGELEPAYNPVSPLNPADESIIHVKSHLTFRIVDASLQLTEGLDFVSAVTAPNLTANLLLSVVPKAPQYRMDT
jgi:hypothetical protein